MLVVGSDGMGSWINHLTEPILKRAFPHTKISFDKTKKPDIVIRSHFHHLEPEPSYSCPYISWSGESYRVSPKKDYAPIFELNTFHDSSIDNNIYLPHLIAEMKSVERPGINTPKKYCCAYAFSNRVPQRERLFWTMRLNEPTCYSFGSSCYTKNNPFELPKNKRGENDSAFNEFGFIVAMENKIAPGYLTEKIGFAYKSGGVPIYWGDSSTVSDFFNPESYIDVSMFTTPDDAGKYAVEVWKDKQKLQKYLDAPITLNSRIDDYFAVYTEYRPWQKKFIDILRDTFPDLS